MRKSWYGAAWGLAIGLALWAGSVQAADGGPADVPAAVIEGERVAARMQDMAGSEEWLRLFGTPALPVRDLLAEARQGEDDGLTAVYRVRLSPETVRRLSGGHSLESLPASLREQGRRNVARAAGLYLNSLEGTQAVAASSLCMAEETFVDRTLDGSALYLYVYRRSAPVLVTFLEGRDHAVLAAGCFLFGRQGEALDTEEAVREAFHGFFDGIEKISDIDAIK